MIAGVMRQLRRMRDFIAGALALEDGGDLLLEASTDGALEVER